MMVEPKPAATVMVVRAGVADIEVFLLRRSSRSAFMPDVFVFPGGRVDPHDDSPSARDQLWALAPTVEPAYVYAAARETFEEAGLLFADTAPERAALASARNALLAKRRTFEQIVADLGVRIDAGALHYFSRWITPSSEPRRFDTRFFVARAPAGQTAQADAYETHDGQWLTPATALARHAAGEFALIFPTIKHLERLAAFTRVDALLAYALRKPVHPVMPDPVADQRFDVPAALEGIW